MNRLIIIGIRKTGTSLELVDSALRRGLNVTIISNPDDRIDGIFPAKVEIKYISADVAEICKWIKSQYPAPEKEIRITTVNDVYACLSSRVNEALNLPGPDAAFVARAVSKFEQKKIFTENNIPTSGYSKILISDQSALEDAIGSLRLPVVVKPSEGTASNGVKLCQTLSEVRFHIEYLTEQKKQRPDLIPSEIVLIEEYLQGTEYCVELFDGHYVGAMRKLKRYGSEFYERGYTSELDTDETTLRNIIEAGTKAVGVAGINWGPAHIDCIVQSGRASIIEINPRIAGSFICDIVRDAYGFNMVDHLLDKLQDKEITVPEIFQPDTAVTGENHVSATVNAFVNTKHFLESINRTPEFNGYCGHILLVSPVSGRTFSNYPWDKIESLPSFVSVKRWVKPGAQLQITTGLQTAIGMVGLFHKQYEQLVRDWREIRKIEEDFFSLPEISAEPA